MKFTYTEHLGFDDKGQAITNDYKFLRTINTEKIFKDETGDEFNAQLGEIVSRLASFEQDPTEACEDLQKMLFQKLYKC